MVYQNGPTIVLCLWSLAHSGSLVTPPEANILKPINELTYNLVHQTDMESRARFFELNSRSETDIHFLSHHFRHRTQLSLYIDLSIYTKKRKVVPSNYHLRPHTRFHMQ
jgi:hypothetical protein